MGFFKDFKRDFAQAVNELMPDKDELAGEYDDEDMVNTFDDNDNMDIAPEDMLENIDDFSMDDNIGTFGDNTPPAHNLQADKDVDEEPGAKKEIPQAEIINDNSDILINTFDQDLSLQMVTELTVEDSVMVTPEEKSRLLEETSDIPAEDVAASDELKALDELDEPDMEENLEDALEVENTEQTEDAFGDIEGIVSRKVNISKDVSEAMIMREDIQDNLPLETARENDDWEGSMSEIEKINQEEMKDSNIDSILSDDTTYITKGTEITGSISTEGCIDIIGIVNGDVTCGGKLILGGKIVGNVNVGELYANAAKIEGEVVTEGSAKIGVGSVIVGNVSASSAVIAGAVNGDIDVKGPVIVDSTAVIMGNIKSRSVQINNGAVIEGFCSQCYSEIDVKSFFE